MLIPAHSKKDELIITHRICMLNDSDDSKFKYYYLNRDKSELFEWFDREAEDYLSFAICNINYNVLGHIFVGVDWKNMVCDYFGLINFTDRHEKIIASAYNEMLSIVKNLGFYTIRFEAIHPKMINNYKSLSYDYCLFPKSYLLNNSIRVDKYIFCINLESDENIKSYSWSKEKILSKYIKGDIFNGNRI